MQFDRESDLEIYYGRILSSCVRKVVDKRRNTGQYEQFGKMYNFQRDESDQCLNITGLGFVIQPCPDQAERQPLSSNNYNCKY